MWAGSGRRRAFCSRRRRSRVSRHPWQQQTLASPYDLQPDTTYVVSVNANAYFVTTGGGLASSVVSGPLSSVADGANGVHSQAAGQFPTLSWNNSNYFVDLVVTDPPVASHAPTVTATTVPTLRGTSPATAKFSQGMNGSTITIVLSLTRTSDGTSVAATVSYDIPHRDGDVRSQCAPRAYHRLHGHPLDGSQSSRRPAARVPRQLGVHHQVDPLSVSALLAGARPCSQNLPTQDGRSGSGPWSYELGVKVRVSQPMTSTAIRFFKSPLETGTHVGRVWTSTGALLSQVTFTGETASGWQQQALPAPLGAHREHDLRRVRQCECLFRRHGWRSCFSGRVPARSRRSPTVRTASTASGWTFPTVSWNNSNYFVDAVVRRAELGVDGHDGSERVDHGTVIRSHRGWNAAGHRDCFRRCRRRGRAVQAGRQQPGC